MQTIDETFTVPRKPVSIAAYGDAHEAHCIRGLLENLGAAVSMHLLGTPSDLFVVLEQGESAPPFLIISGHGDENGFVFGEFGPEIDTSALVSGSLPAAAINGHVNLPGKVIVSTACSTGTPEFAAAFTKGGARAYIAPINDPDGPDALLFVHHFFHQCLARIAHVDSAFEHARNYDANSQMFRIYA